MGFRAVALAELVLLAVIGAAGVRNADGRNADGSTAAVPSVRELTAGIDRQIARLRDIVMHKEVTRFSSAGGRTRRLDEFDASVEMADGVDHFEWLRHNGRPWSGAERMPGAWSFGEFATVLRISREALDNPSVRLVPADDADEPAVTAAFHYPASSARWFVSVGSHVYWLDFQGAIRISTATGEVQGISWISAAPARESGIRQVERTVRFARADVGGETWLLPEYAEYRVVHSGSRVEWNAARFNDAARYRSLVTVKFEE